MENFQSRAAQNFPFKFTVSRDVELAYGAYETSHETDNLGSEEKRTIYGELIDFDWGTDWNRQYEKIKRAETKTKTVEAPVKKVVVDDDEGRSQAQATPKSRWWKSIQVKKGNQPKSLNALTLEAYARGFKGETVDERISCQNAVDFGNMADIDLPLTPSLLKLDNDVYWKRVVISKIRDFGKLETLFRSSETDWRQIAVELIYGEYCENLIPTEHQFPQSPVEVQDFSNLCSNLVRDLNIREMQPERRPLQDECAKVINYRPEDCAHYPLDFIRFLSHLESLKISFKSVPLATTYEWRFFQVAPEDIRHLSVGLGTLARLHTLEITETNLEEGEKIGYLLSALENSKTMRNLTLTHCSINGAIAGGHFANFFAKNLSLEHLELGYNSLDFEFCETFAAGIEIFRKVLHHLGLSMNGIFYNGLDLILKAIAKRDNVYQLKISCCDGPIIDEGNAVIEELANLIKCSKKLQALDMTSNKIRGESVGRRIIAALVENFTIESFDCFNCDFSVKEEVEAKVVVQRNIYYRDNPILRKESFSRDDEIEIERWLRRRKHPLLLKHEREFLPTENYIPKWKCEAAENSCNAPIEFYENYVVLNK